MDPRFSLQAVAHVPVVHWPWVWWQLFWLRSWCEATSRDVLYEIQPTGRVVTFMVSDDTRDLRAWMARQAEIYRDHWAAMHNNSGEIHLSAFHYWMGRIMECGTRFEASVGALVAVPEPAIRDSS